MKSEKRSMPVIRMDIDRIEQQFANVYNVRMNISIIASKEITYSAWLEPVIETQYIKCVCEAWNDELGMRRFENLACLMTSIISIVNEGSK